MQKYEYVTIYPDQIINLSGHLNDKAKLGWRPILAVGDKIILERPIDEVETISLKCLSAEQINAYNKRMSASKKRLK